ncbi:glycosyltransferase family 4 protein [Gloeobacter kilaueensis]|uniref:Glycosyl transferase group 1 n=1 Tax=Gloeobacter kilaueensis (strain ATCC BAA-2537 / CCAP 1431/1 / ULC 316 / JS1) TaxID=1183438 RepID=U5QQI0_GLOK1|nr:glycosyltransferase family 4 protein [Gloeobacter kilaueensis]AGY59869.1 glycosyl transferase group 1 [Gloeobacter kilaueensis JS1]
MRIAQVAPLYERVPPPGYGGIELVVGLLTDELVRRGHEVTLFASGDSETLARLNAVHERALRLDPHVREHGIYEMMQMSRVYQRADQFDIIHSHVGCVALSYSGLVKTPTVHTLHGIFTPDNSRIYRQCAQQPFVSISDAQREPGLGLNYCSTVYNGIDSQLYQFRAESAQEPYLAFVGRISPEKGPLQAIEVARRTGWTLKMAGKVDPVDRRFYSEQVEPLIDGVQIQYLGEVSHHQKAELLGGAVATLFPITWREPFGLVMIESMACGTPVIGMALGAAPEVIRDGVTGYLVNSVDEMAERLGQIRTISRQACRDHVMSTFTVERMTDGYEAAYLQVLASRNGSLTARAKAALMGQK